VYVKYLYFKMLIIHLKMNNVITSKFDDKSIHWQHTIETGERTFAMSYVCKTLFICVNIDIL